MCEKEKLPDPGPGWRLATEGDAGAKEFAVSHDGKNWTRTELEEGMSLEISSKGFTWGFKHCYFQFARVPVAAKLVLEAGKEYAWGESRVAYVGEIARHFSVVFAHPNGSIFSVSREYCEEHFRPWVDPPPRVRPAFRRCKLSTTHGDAEAVQRCGESIFYDRSFRRIDPISVIGEPVWHDAEFVGGGK